MKAKMMSATAIVLALGLCLPPQAKAWNDFGHMLVAEIAYQQLEPSVRTRVAALLKLNPDHRKWVRGVPNSKKNEIAFLMASRWPDVIKGARGYTNDSIEGSGADASRNIGYSDKLQHRYWHFKDIAFSPDGTSTAEAEEPNAETQIVMFRAAISQAATSDDVKSYDIAWLIHLIGDVHQPLHATARYTSDLPNGDRGGNSVKICRESCGGNLHSYWDGLLGSSDNPERARVVANGIAPAPAGPAGDTDVAAWIRESFEVAQTAVYADPPIGVGAGPFTITAQYRDDAKAVARERAALAGARLAKLLNDALR